MRITKYYFNFWIHIIKSKNIPLRNINFSKPWWELIITKKFTWLFILSGIVAAHVTYTIAPLLITRVFHTQDISLLFALMLWIGAEVWKFLTGQFYAQVIAQDVTSMQQNAYRFFLTVDPIYHITKKSGALFAKIERGIRAYEDLIDIIYTDLLSIIVSIITVITSFLTINSTMGLLAFILLFVLLSINISFILFTVQAFEKNYIHADDQVKSLSMESLTQIQLVRSSFASNEWNNKVKGKSNKLKIIVVSYWLAYFVANLVTRISYLVSIGIMGYYLLWQIKINTINNVQAAAFLLTYIYGSNKLKKTGYILREIFVYITRVNDLYAFINNFGKQTFPVLESDPSLQVHNSILVDTISISATNITFAYPGKNPILSDNSLVLKTPRTKDNKLFGIIGPSGVGKTTLISILGGQLHPQKGNVTIDTIPIYQVNDITRRNLIALQGQIASSLSGTVRENLLLGAQDIAHKYSDKELIDLLQKVGIWHVFEDKEGLNSVMGEGGLNLSGGQRQRLNFASLYLRAKHFKPQLILIDEPTSSIDEISERAITAMINELASHAVTFVIAHRLHTLESADKILDLSLTQSKELTFQTREKLIEISEYYRKLREGKVSIEE